MNRNLSVFFANFTRIAMFFLKSASLFKAVSFLSALFLLTISLGCSEHSSINKQNTNKATNITEIMGGSNIGNADHSQHQYAKVIKGKKFEFPKDHSPHNDYRIEWWYLTANLTTDKGQHIGIQWTQFRVALSPQAKTDNKGLNNPWQTQQIYFSHSAITSDNFHFSDEKWSREHPQLAGVKSQPYGIFIDNWRWQSTSSKMFPASLSVESHTELNSTFGYQLELTTDKPFYAQGQNGFSPKTQDSSVASYYYSQPFIDIKGRVNFNGEQHKVTGKGWLDREWSSQFLKNSQQGWDWFALRLDENTTLMLFQLRAMQNTQENFYTAKLMFADGSSQDIENKQIKMKPTDFHQIDGVNYPTRWHIQIKSHHVDLKLAALNPNSIMDLSIKYWEGPVYFYGSHKGSGYMELTGY